MALHDQLHNAAERDGDRVALVCDGRHFTYAELAAAADRVASLLQQHGVEPGDRVVVFLPNSADAVVSIYGVWRAGGCLVMADGDSTADNLAFRVAHSSAKVLIAPHGKGTIVRAALADMPSPPLVVFAGVGEPDESIPATVQLASGDAGSFSPVQVDPHAPAAIIYTSGSTGRPKGVTHSQHSIATVVAAVGDYLQHSRDDVVLCVLQLSFGYGLLQLLVTFDHAGRLVLRRGFGLPFDLVTTIETERVTGLAGVPTLFALMRELSDAALARASSLRYITSAAAALPPAQIERVRAMFPSAQLFVMHGQTECLRTTYLPPDQLDLRPASVGRGMGGIDLWLENEARQPVQHPGEGELLVRGENVMLGYWQDPVATAEILSPGRAPHERTLRTRDVFRTDADGYYHFVSRTDDIIKTRGEKVSPHEIEHRLAQLAEILEARVIGVPDDLLGQAIRAELVLRKGCTLSERDVRAFLRSGLEPYKMPKSIIFVDSLPKSSSGKVRRVP